MWQRCGVVRTAATSACQLTGSTGEGRVTMEGTGMMVQARAEGRTWNSS
jgi:hypothetical protein